MKHTLRTVALLVTILFTPGLVFAQQIQSKTHNYCCNPDRNPATRKAKSLASKIFNEAWLPRRIRESGFVARLTSYTGGDPTQGTGLHTALGTVAGYGQVAVDPRVIPLGTYLYIPGYGVARATDTGGAVRGTHIDLCFGIGSYGTQAYRLAKQWGTRVLQVYIVPREMLALLTH
jgi:3D (Asp-Asp-Asp) domain-containing protein